MVGDVPLLGKPRERELFGMLRDIDTPHVARRAARDALILANLRLVVWASRRQWVRRVIEASGTPEDDFVSEGTIALMRAVDNFDPAHASGHDTGRPVAFSTYASRSIIQAMRQFAARRLTLVRVPDHLYHDAIRAIEGEDAINSRNRADSPTLAAAVRTLSASRVDCDGAAIAARAEPDDRPSEVAAEAKARLSRLLPILDRRERDVIRRRFGLTGAPPMTLEGVGNRHGICKERARQIEIKALAKLRARAGRLGIDG